MTDKEQIICKYKFQDKEIFDGKPYCTCFSELCKDLPPCDDNCQIYEDYKQLARKTQECEELKEKLRELELKNATLQNRNQQLDGSMTECEGLKKELDLYKTWYRAKHDDIKNLLGSYRKALEKIEEVFREDHGGDYDYIKWRIDDIINKAKGDNK